MSEFGISAQNLRKLFNATRAVDDVSFSIPESTLYSLLGPNGAGKTTTLNILSCNLMPDGGDALIKGHSVLTKTQEVRKFIGICPQENVLYSHLSILENLLFFGKMYEVPPRLLKDRAIALIDRMDLTEKRHSKISTLSGGQKRRVNLLAGLIHDPEVIFLDEPTAGLDPQTRRMLWDYIMDLKTAKKTIILTTHYMDEADILSDRVGIMDHGKIIAEDTPARLKESIGRGDNVTFKLNGAISEITAVFSTLKESHAIDSVQPLADDAQSFRITALDGIGKIGQFMNIFLAHKIQVEDIAIRANSLENVFLSLTGRNLRE